MALDLIFGSSKANYPLKGPVFESSSFAVRSKLRGCLNLSEVLSLSWQRLSLLRVLTSKCRRDSKLQTTVINPGFLGNTKFIEKHFLMVAPVLLAIDIILGVAGVSFVMKNGGTNCQGLFSYCLQILGSGIFSLTGVVDWLMNNPAGLKLNKELANTLGAFFRHHISLWQMYINYLTSFLEGGDLFLCSFGVLGLSFHSALVVDFIALFTIHVHCFYIYMARLYNVQLRGLVALGRFFRGKKWNPLRRRVDHITSSVDQLFVGSFFLCIFVFLLPTTLTFYIVFTALRFLVSLSQLPFILISRWTSLFYDFPRLTERLHDTETETGQDVSSIDCFGITEFLRKLIFGEIF